MLAAVLSGMWESATGRVQGPPDKGMPHGFPYPVADHNRRVRVAPVSLVTTVCPIYLIWPHAVPDWTL